MDEFDPTTASTGRLSALLCEDNRTEETGLLIAKLPWLWTATWHSPMVAGSALFGRCRLFFMTEEDLDNRFQIFIRNYKFANIIHAAHTTDYEV